MLMPMPATLARSFTSVDAVDRSAVYAHAQPQLRMFFQGATDFDRAFDRIFRAAVKNQRQPIAGRDLN